MLFVCHIDCCRNLTANVELNAIFRHDDRIIPNTPPLTPPLAPLLLYPSTTQPSLRSFNEYGKRVDDVVTSPAWKAQHRAAACEGLISIAYERISGAEAARLHQFAKLLMYVPASGMYSCPLAMTDGAARLIEVLNLENKMPASAKSASDNVFAHLSTRDPDQFWTSGQWMTEQASGSDVSMSTRTVAKQQPDGSFKLYGLKWFTSAVDAAVSVALARIVPNGMFKLTWQTLISCLHFIFLNDFSF